MPRADFFEPMFLLGETQEYLSYLRFQSKSRRKIGERSQHFDDLFPQQSCAELGASSATQGSLMRQGLVLRPTCIALGLLSLLFGALFGSCGPPSIWLRLLFTTHPMGPRP